MRISLALAFLGLTASCVSMDMTTARSVSMKPGKGGVVTLNPPEDQRARDKAQVIMDRTCSGKKVAVVEEGEVAVGVSTSGSSSYDGGSAGTRHASGLIFGGSSPSTSTNSVQKNVTEWRITYECK